MGIFATMTARGAVGAALLCLVLAVAVACGRAIDRPLRGASPGAEAAPTAGVPPTLSPSEALRFRALSTPSPGTAPSPQASPSPSAAPLPPIVRTIAPANNGEVPAGGPVTVSAVLVGRGADLATATLQLDGADAAPQIDKRTAREWTIRATRPLAPGTHTARVQVRDASGAAGGFTWRFTVGSSEPSEEEQPQP
jgi:hypothetical protein